MTWSSPITRVFGCSIYPQSIIEFLMVLLPRKWQIGGLNFLHNTFSVEIEV